MAGAQSHPDAEARVSVTIDGTEVRAPVEATVLEAARSAGIEIPTLCHHDELAGYGSCRLCLVEVEARGRSRLVVSCLYPVEDGLQVRTETEAVAKHRKVILELLAARWEWLPRELLEKYGADRDRFEKNTTFCVLCGLCVRHCAEVRGHHVLGFVGRGTERQVVIYPERAEKHCPQCAGGEMPCLEICPTGVISSEFAVAGLTPRGKRPLAYPVCIRDDDNVSKVADLVGDK